MASNYPTSLDTTATLPSAAGVGANLSTFPHSALTGNVNDAVIAIETELGVAPSGAETTVKARLDRITPTLGALTSWTASIQQPGAVTVTNSYTRYIKMGRLFICFFDLAVTGTGTAANVITLTGIPAVGVSGTQTCGTGHLFDTSAGQYYPFVVFQHATSLTFFPSFTGAIGASQRMGNVGFTAALAAGDSIVGTFMYEANAD